MRATALFAAASAALVLLATGCGGGSAAEAPPAPAKAAAPRCAYPAGWQRLANRVGAPVYCPGWLPGPLTAQIGGRWNNIDSVGRDRSYLESFVWQETSVSGGAEYHVNLRGYPGRTRIPNCTEGGGDHTPIPCFADPHGRVLENGIDATLFTVNQDADQWHILLAWRHRGSLYTISEHLAPPVNYGKLVRFLHRELRSLVLIEPSRGT